MGDIVDGWRLKKSWYWARSHNDVVQKILRKARKGTKVIYVPGNHDEMLRDYTGLHFGGVLDTFALRNCGERAFLRRGLTTGWAMIAKKINSEHDAWSKIASEPTRWGQIMAARRKLKSSRRAKPKKSKRRVKRAVSAKKSVRKVTARKKVAKKRAVSRRPRQAAKPAQRRTQVPAAETVIVDTIEQPAPGIVVVTETEYTVRQDDDA